MHKSELKCTFARARLSSRMARSVFALSKMPNLKCAALYFWCHEYCTRAPLGAQVCRTSFEERVSWCRCRSATPARFVGSQRSGISSIEEKSWRTERLPKSRCSAPPAEMDGRLMILANMLLMLYSRCYTMPGTDIWKEDGIPIPPQIDGRDM